MLTRKQVDGVIISSNRRTILAMYPHIIEREERRKALDWKRCDRCRLFHASVKHREDESMSNILNRDIHLIIQENYI